MVRCFSKLVTRPPHFKYVYAQTCVLSTRKTVGPEIQSLRRIVYKQMEKKWEEKVKMEELTDSEKVFYQLHKEACQKESPFYIDPQSGLMVSTRFKHFLRGRCCGSGCRHCPYEHANVPAEKKALKKFNTAFYVDQSQS